MRLRVIKILLKIIVFSVLTLLTQVGGVLYLISFLIHRPINSRTKNKILRSTFKVLSFLFIYTFATFLVIPFLARSFGREPLLFGFLSPKPQTWLTCFLNRNYVRPELKNISSMLGEKMYTEYRSTPVYLDANFPFFNGFPLFPHLSHDDGKKLDLAFFYTDKRTGERLYRSPSLLGYGIYEDPLPREKNTARACAQKGFWQYGILGKITPQGSRGNYKFDPVRTKAMIEFLAAQPEIGKIFIEPHLKTRLKLTSDKIRFHGCQAVRHDDHVHVQLK